MKFEQVSNLPDKDFRRVVGVKRQTFNKMVEIVAKTAAKKKEEQKAPGGRKPILSIENCVLMTLEYLREYRTYKNIGISFNLSESRTFENIRWVENVLIQSKAFSLPGKKALLDSNNEIEEILIDATECPIERPKKTA